MHIQELSVIKPIANQTSLEQYAVLLIVQLDASLDHLDHTFAGFKGHAHRLSLLRERFKQQFTVLTDQT